MREMRNTAHLKEQYETIAIAVKPNSTREQTEEEGKSRVGGGKRESSKYQQDINE
jgi:hypothetical protein